MVTGRSQWKFAVAISAGTGRLPLQHDETMLFFIIAATTILGADATTARPPNIVLIVADDLGWADVGYHASEIRSPTIDRLAAEGVKLESHYVMPQCTPTRVALLTGRYPSRFGNHCTQAANTKALPDGTPTLASLLKSAGYDTGIFGKWHLGSKPEWGPNHFGFKESYGSLAGAVGMYDHRYRLTDPEFTRTWHRNETFIDETGHATDLVTKEAVQWIGQKHENPFFLYLPFHSVHVPLVEEQKWLDMNPHIAAPDRRLFAAAVSHLDHSIRSIVSALEQNSQLENTLIIFTSDNGGLHHHGGNTYPPPDPAVHNFSSNRPLRGQKGDTYEGGIRVPAFAYWKGHLMPRTVTAPLHAVDWLPTLCTLAGISTDKVPKGDGKDIWPIVSGQEKEATERTLYWVWGNKRQRVALRQGPWKLVRNGPGAKIELFNLDTDPNETRDLAPSHAAKLEELKNEQRAQRSQDAL